VKRLYALALHLYPRSFRTRFGQEMQHVFDTAYSHSRTPARFLLHTVIDLLASALEERFRSMSFDRTLRRVAIPLAAVALLGLSSTMIQAYVISSPSMAGTLMDGDHILVNKLARTPQFGEMVVFRYPVDPDAVFLKRVIGVPGDRIRIENKQVIRNGQRIEEAYAEHRTTYVDTYRDNFPGKPNVTLPETGERMLKDSLEQGDIVVPPGMFFVLGDNRDQSLDSRFWGFVPRENIIGRPWLVYWSSDLTRTLMLLDR
jgi:signal peptidase I